jgi:ABC-type antimicrobial peptide transport system permease subunit
VTHRVAQRSRELGIRAALGDSPRRLATAVIGEAQVVGTGRAILSLVMSVWVGRVIRASLVIVSRVESILYPLAVLGLNLAATGAVVAPAATAWAADAVAVLRQ